MTNIMHALGTEGHRKKEQDGQRCKRKGEKEEARTENIQKGLQIAWSPQIEGDQKEIEKCTGSLEQQDDEGNVTEDVLWSKSI